MKTRREFLAGASKCVMGLGVVPALSMSAEFAQRRKTGFVYDDRYLDHVLPQRRGEPHPERPLRLRKIREIFAARGLDQELTPIPLLAMLVDA